MPTTYNDQFYVVDPGSPPAFNTNLTVQNFSYVDEDDDGFIRPGDTVNGGTVTSVWVGDTLTVRVPGVGNTTITGVTFYITGQPAVFTPTDGTILVDARFRSSTFVNTSTQVPVSDLAPPCFTPGTLIETKDGGCPVEQIEEGDMVLTRDDGYQPVLWIGRCVVPAQGRYAPIRIARGALGNDRDLIVSPQHRVLIKGWAAELYAGQEEILATVAHLVDGEKIQVIEGGEVEYIHLGFATHALIRSEGIWTESHFASAAARAEARDLFPGSAQSFRLVRPAAKKHESRAIAASVLS